MFNLKSGLCEVINYNEKGSIYFYHESSSEKGIYFYLAGFHSSKANNLEDGICLDDKFDFEIQTKDKELTVSLMCHKKDTITKTVDISNRGYDLPGQYLYSKASTYLQGNSANQDDYVQTTYYKMQSVH